MAKENKKENTEEIEEIEIEKVEVEAAPGTLAEVEFPKVMSENFLLYAVSTLLDRALPQIDGLLPVQRRVLLAMKRANVHSKGPYKKSATIVGDTMGKYHPHGDQSIYGSLARMAQDFSYRVPLIDGQGAFGSIDGDNPAAMRYTEARMSPSAEEITADLHEKILPDYMGRNFDESETEPMMMPTRFPNLLINGSYGIATGMTAFFLPHNPKEAIDLCSWRLRHPDATIGEAIKRISGPDFPTGGSVLNDEGLKSLYKTGKGRVTGMAKAHIEKGDKGKDKIVITELPWMVQKGGDSGILKRMGVQYAEGKYPEFESLNDFSDESMRIEIGLKRGTNASMVLQKLLKNTALRKTYGCEMNCVIEGRPRTLNLLELIDHFLDFRRYVVIKRAEKRIEEIELRLYKLDAYMKVVDAIDKVVETIKKSKNREDAKPKLQKLLKVDDQQAQWIVEMPLGNLTRLNVFELKEEVKNLNKELKELQKFIKTKELVTEAMIEEFNGVKESWKRQKDVNILDRRTSLIEPPSGGDDTGIDEMMTSTEPAEDCMLMISRDGRALAALGNLKRGGSLKLGVDDSLVVFEQASTNDEYLVFSDQLKAYRLRLAELEPASKKSSGDRLTAILGISKDEKVISAIPLRKAKKGSENDGDAKSGVEEVDLKQDIFFATSEGIIKRTCLEEFSRANAAGVAAGKLRGDDRLVAAILNPAGDKGEVLLLANNGKVLRFSTSVSRVMGRTAAGVKGMKVPEGSEIISVQVLSGGEEEYVLLHESGLIKRFPLAQINPKGRGGQGVGIGKTDGAYGKPCASTVVKKDQTHVLLETEDSAGRPQEFATKDIPEGKINTTAKKWKAGGVRRFL